MDISLRSLTLAILPQVGLGWDWVAGGGYSGCSSFPMDFGIRTDSLVERAQAPAEQTEGAGTWSLHPRCATLGPPPFPQAVPVLVAENNRQGLEALAKQARAGQGNGGNALLRQGRVLPCMLCLALRAWMAMLRGPFPTIWCMPLAPLLPQVDTTLPRLLREYGQCVVAREVWDSSPTLEACLSVMEAIMGEVRRELSREVWGAVLPCVPCSCQYVNICVPFSSNDHPHPTRTMSTLWNSSCRGRQR